MMITRTHNQRPKLSSTRMIAIVTIVLCQLTAQLATGQLMVCPQVCSCIWRNGKQTTICENQNLISIPNQISASTQVLDLNSNNFQILPSRAFQERGLINLQKLFLPKCKLGAIAEDAFTQLTNLVELDLSDNLLTTIPVRALSNATNLRRLLLNNNHIATIGAESFATLSNLKFLNISGCQTHTIEPRAFYGLHELEYLYLHSNQLTTLSYQVVQDLPALYSFDLYRNPWQCSCEMRAAREWMLRNNVGQSLPPTCEMPARLNGMMWNSLDLDDFACEPDIITTSVEVIKTVGSNATLSCVVKGLPEPKIHWFIEDHGQQRNLSGMLSEQKYLLTEEHNESTVQSTLTIVNLDLSDDSGLFICAAENRAGLKSKNFTVQVTPSSAFSNATANWSRMELAGGFIAIILSLIVGFVLVALLLARSRKFIATLTAKKFGGTRPGDSDSLSKPAQLSQLMKNGSGVGGVSQIYNTGTGMTYTNGMTTMTTPTGYGHHLSMLGLDGIDKKPEIFLQPQHLLGQTRSTPVPDVVVPSGFEMNTFASNSSVGGPYLHHSNNPIHMMYQQQQETEASNYDIYGQYPGPEMLYQSQAQIAAAQQQQQQLHQQQMQQAPEQHLYRAVMVQPPISTSNIIANQAATTTASPASNYGIQSGYPLSQSHYDLRRTSPDSSQFSQPQNPMLRTALSQRHLAMTPLTLSRVSPPQAISSGYMYSNPAAADYYDDDVFHPAPMTGLRPGQAYYDTYQDQQPMMHAPAQPIYGTAMPVSRRASPWHHTNGAITPAISGPLFVSAATPTPNMMVRYSPDEGYADGDGSSTNVTLPAVGHLEATTV